MLKILNEMYDLKTLKKLKELDKEAYEKGKENITLNLKLGFDITYLKPSFLMYFNKDKLKEIIYDEEIQNILENIEKIKYIEKNKSKFKKEFKKIINSKLNDFRIILALFADKVLEITYNPNKELVKIVEEIFLPLSHIIGINYYIAQFEDYIIRSKYPKEYKKVLEKAKKHLIRDNREIDFLIKELEEFRKYPDEEIYGRIKKPYSVFKKIYVRKEKLENITDYVAIRIITKDIKDCYSWMGHIFSKWEPILGKIKDYIKKPKPNGYKSLHATVQTPFGLVEFQVRTKKMHAFAEYGIAAHWRYKKINDFNIANKITSHIIGRDLKKIDFKFGKEKIFVYTPKGDTIILNKGSTIVDFAYAIHTEIGNHLVRAIVNGYPAPLNQKLKDFDLVMVFTDKNKKPSRKWLEFVKTQKAIDKIKQYLNITSKNKKTKQEENKFYKTIIKNLKIAKCCNPFPDDDIAIFKNTKKQYIVHTLDCLLKNNKKYLDAPENIKNLLKTKTLIIESTNIKKTLELIKKKILYDTMKINSNKIELTKKYNSREEYNKDKEILSMQQEITNVSLS